MKSKQSGDLYMDIAQFDWGTRKKLQLPTGKKYIVELPNKTETICLFARPTIYIERYCIRLCPERSLTFGQTKDSSQCQNKRAPERKQMIHIPGQ